MMRYLVRTGRRIRTTSAGISGGRSLEVVQLARPRAVIMENVPDMALDREMFILRSMTERA